MSTELQVLSASAKQAGPGYAYFVAFVAAVGGFLFGYDLVIINGAQIFLRDHFHLTAGELGFATSSAILGCVAGPALGASLCDRLGRKSTLIIAALLFAAGAVGTAVPRSITVFNVFRFVGGIGVGLASLASPLYIAEIAPAPSRGRLGIMYQLAITVGATTAIVVAWWIARTVPDVAVNWRWMFASMLVPVVAFVVLLLAVPQSPRWLVGQNRPAEALAIMTKINGPGRRRKSWPRSRRRYKQNQGRSLSCSSQASGRPCWSASCSDCSTTGPAGAASPTTCRRCFKWPATPKPATLSASQSCPSRPTSS